MTLERKTPLRRTPFRKITPEQRRAWNEGPSPKRVKSSSNGNGHTHGVRKIIKRRSKGICERCWDAPAGQFHHRRMRSQGGKDTELNLVHLCAICHHWIHHNVQDAYDSGWLVKRWQDPDEIPWQRR